VWKCVSWYSFLLYIFWNNFQSNINEREKYHENYYNLIGSSFLGIDTIEAEFQFFFFFFFFFERLLSSFLLNIDLRHFPAGRMLFLVILYCKRELCRIQSGYHRSRVLWLFFIDEIIFFFFLISSIVIGPLIFQAEDLRRLFP